MHVADVPFAWSRGPTAYLLLSDAYRDEAVDARSRGWPVREIAGSHLHMVVDPEAVAVTLEEMARP